MMRQLPAPSDGGGRVETGAVRFGDDWAGLFIRGDNAIALRDAVLFVLGRVGEEEIRKDFMLWQAAETLKEVAEVVETDVVYRPPQG